MTITLIGAGNVGFHLGKRLFKKGIPIHQVYSRNFVNASVLAAQIGANPTDDLKRIDGKADVYIICVHDDAIGSVAKNLSKNKVLKERLIVHTSGAVSSQLIANFFPSFGIFYPLQTFSKERKVRFSNIPICIDACQKSDLKLLRKLGKKISKKVVKLSDKERSILHVAAVVVNNFTNHLFHIGNSILDQENIEFDLLKPLIQETVQKIEHNAPFDMQTGPARRGDQATIIKHLKYLEKFPEYLTIYQSLSKQIENAYRR